VSLWYQVVPDVNGLWHIVAMAEQEKPDSRPKCGYKVTVPTKIMGKDTTERKPCGSEERLYSVSGKGRWGAPKETPVCKDHIEKAYKEWSADSFRPLDIPTGKR
jgi:hypothetical protein